MTGLGIGLLIIGAVFFIGSFFVSEKLSKSDMDEIKGLSENEMQALLEKHLKEADQKIDDALESKTDESLESFVAKADKETNNRIMSIGEYADSVFDSMNKTHEEILFLYQMLNDKQESLTNLTKTLGEAESHVRELLTEAERQQNNRTTDQYGRPLRRTVIDKTDLSVFPPLPEKGADIKEPVQSDSANDTPADQAISELKAQVQETDVTDTKQAAEKPDDAAIQPEKSARTAAGDSKLIREKIISMYHQGYSLLDIARETGKGMGEVQLILELFDEKEEEP